MIVMNMVMMRNLKRILLVRLKKKQKEEELQEKEPIVKEVIDPYRIKKMLEMLHLLLI